MAKEEPDLIDMMVIERLFRCHKKEQLRRIVFTISLFLLAFYSNAQVSYTDIAPDIVLNGSDTCFIDINADGIDDLKFTQEDSASGLNGNGVGVTLLHYDIEFIGDNPSYDPSHLYPFKVDSNNVINQNADNKQWVTKLGGNDAIRVMFIYFFSGVGIGEWTGGINNGYLGVRLKINNQWHYGWVRVDVSANNATQITIKDYAYNEEANEKIHAGQTQNFGPSAVAVSYEDSLCGIVVGFVRKNNTPSLLYNIIYKKMQWGTFDSISAVFPTQACYFLDSDPLISVYTSQYRVSAVDSIKGESLLSDTASLGFLTTDSASTGNINLIYNAHYGLDLEDYSFVYRLDSIYQPLPFDSILNSDTNLVDVSNYWANGCYNYIAKSVLKLPLSIVGYGIMDTLRSNPASNYPLQIFNPVAEFKVELPVGGSLAITAQFIDKSKAAIFSWNWSFGDGYTSTMQNPTHNYTVPGIYDVRLAVSNCFGMDIIEKKSLINVGLNPNKQELGLKLYPNPTKDYITLELAPNHRIITVKIYSLLGKQVISKQNIHQSTYRLNVSSILRGVYLIEIITDTGIVNRKIVVE